MSTKGRDFSVKERRGRSPSLARKVEFGQQTRALINPPSSLERKHGLTSTESRKVPIYDKHTVSSSLYALNTIKPPSVDNTRLVPQSKVISLRSKFNEKKVTHSHSHINTNENTNTTGSTKTKDVRKPDTVKEIVHGKKQTRQLTRLLNASSSAKEDHETVIHYEDDKTATIVNSDILTLENHDKQRVDLEGDDHDILTCEVDERVNQQDQPDTSSDDQHPCFEVVDQDVECHEEPEVLKEVPKEEERRDEDEVVAHGKKEVTAAYDEYVKEEDINIKKQRRKRVKALVDAFEILISLECNDLQNNYQHR